MLTLGIDTATKTCTVGLVKDGEAIVNYEVNIGMTHSEGLLPQIEQIFSRTGIDKKAIDLIGISIGPGSFTGLRIGLATAEAIAYSFEIPITSINTLKALAYNVPIEGIRLACVLDAQRGNYYLAEFEWEDEKIIQKTEVEVIAKADLLKQLGLIDKPVLILGESHKIKASELASNTSLAKSGLKMPKGSSVALLAEEQYKLETHEKNDFFGLEPYYIRRSQAEVMLDEKIKKAKEAKEAVKETEK